VESDRPYGNIGNRRHRLPLFPIRPQPQNHGGTKSHAPTRKDQTRTPGEKNEKRNCPPIKKKELLKRIAKSHAPRKSPQNVRTRKGSPVHRRGALVQKTFSSRGVKKLITELIGKL
jgi:hypothetical protein